jgi:hypothetical protein
VAFFASQVACILSEAEVVDGMLDYWKFVPVAAKILQVRPCYNAQDWARISNWSAKLAVVTMEYSTFARQCT